MEEPGTQDEGTAEQAGDELPDFDESWRRPPRQRSDVSWLLSRGYPAVGETAIPNVGPSTAHVHNTPR